MLITEAAGSKRRCLSCASAFFDLARTPIICPKCGAEFKVVELPRSRPMSNSWRNPAGVSRPPIGK
jgi:hypothetical protein